MKIRILKTTKAASCPLGIKIKEYVAGNTEEIFDELAKVFIDNKWGTLVSEEEVKEADVDQEQKFEEKERAEEGIEQDEEKESVEEVIEEKAIEKAPENKAIKKAPKNKSKKSRK